MSHLINMNDQKQDPATAKSRQFQNKFKPLYFKSVKFKRI